MLSNQEIKKIYARMINHRLVLESDDIQLMYLLKFLPGNKSQLILDAGCGDGKYAFYLGQHGYRNVHAIDLFERIESGEFYYQQASLDSLPFNKSFFDFIYCNSVIFYLEKPERGIQEFNRALKIGGLVFITAHTKYSLFTIWRCLKRFLGIKSLKHLEGVRFYSAYQYVQMLRRNGFEIICIDGYTLSFFIYPSYKFLGLICRKIFGIHLPMVKNRITRSKTLAYIKSVIGYHSIIVAQKTSHI
jgi:SAM-dependent methyltransferase